MHIRSCSPLQRTTGISQRREQVPQLKYREGRRNYTRDDAHRALTTWTPHTHETCIPGREKPQPEESSKINAPEA